jgi:hypothetical protein
MHTVYLDKRKTEFRHSGPDHWMIYVLAKTVSAHEENCLLTVAIEQGTRTRAPFVRHRVKTSLIVGYNQKPCQVLVGDKLLDSGYGCSVGK